MASTVIAAATVILFSLLSIATVVYNAGFGQHLLRGLVGFGLLPRWTFFAPVPATSNLYLLYRDIYPNGAGTPWRVLHGMERGRSLFTFAWNPDKRLRKALHDLITSFASQLVGTRPEMAKLSRPYLLILHHVSSLPRLPGPVATQFLIMEGRANERAHVIFSSEPHRL